MIGKITYSASLYTLLLSRSNIAGDIVDFRWNKFCIYFQVKNNKQLCY